MKKILFSLLMVLGLSSFGFAQAQPKYIESCTLNATATTCPLQNEESSGITYHKLSWTLQGNNSGSTGLLQYSDDGGTNWTTLITGTTTSNNTSILTAGVHRTWRILLSGFTATSVGASITLTHAAYYDNISVSSGGAIQIDQTTPGTTNGIVCNSGCAGGTTDTDDGTVATAQVTGIQIAEEYVFDGTNWKRLTTSAAGSGLATGLLTVQGNASGTPIPTILTTGAAAIGKLTANGGVVIGDVNNPQLALAQNSTTSGELGPLDQCATTTAAPTYTTAKTNPLSCDTAGDLRITVPADVANTTPPTYANGDPVTHLEYALNGQVVFFPYQNPANAVNGTTAAITDTTSTSVIASAGAGVRNYITQCMVTNSHATVGTFVKILDGASIIAEGYAAALGGGFVAPFPYPLRGTAATAVNAQAVTTGANFIVSCSGFKGA